MHPRAPRAGMPAYCSVLFMIMKQLATHLSFSASLLHCSCPFSSRHDSTRAERRRGEEKLSEISFREPPAAASESLPGSRGPLPFSPNANSASNRQGGADDGEQVPRPNGRSTALRVPYGAVRWRRRRCRIVCRPLLAC